MLLHRGRDGIETLWNIRITLIFVSTAAASARQYITAS
jgi:hypothetical protein